MTLHHHPAEASRMSVLADPHAPETFEIGGYRAVVFYRRSYCDDLHWHVKHWGAARGTIANGNVWRFSSIQAARQFAQEWADQGRVAA